MIEFRHKSPDAKVEEILEIVHQPKISVPQATIKAKSRLELVLIKQLLVLVEELDNYDKTIMQLFKTLNDAPIFAGLPGADKRLAPKLLAEWGDNRTLYDSSSSVQALAGTSPVAFQSGKYNKRHVEEHPV
ncbi:transposase [Paenibacillus terreus]|uniref:Transposase n=1 Tax=Paenibacillus terreus TaxID=1387834 RepID=A0ABV5BDJ4_9BACL